MLAGEKEGLASFASSCFCVWLSKFRRGFGLAKSLPRGCGRMLNAIQKNNQLVINFRMSRLTDKSQKVTVDKWSSVEMQYVVATCDLAESYWLIYLNVTLTTQERRG